MLARAEPVQIVEDLVGRGVPAGPVWRGRGGARGAPRGRRAAGTTRRRSLGAAARAAAPAAGSRGQAEVDEGGAVVLSGRRPGCRDVRVHLAHGSLSSGRGGRDRSPERRKQNPSASHASSLTLRSGS